MLSAWFKISQKKILQKPNKNHLRRPPNVKWRRCSLALSHQAGISTEQGHLHLHFSLLGTILYLTGPLLPWRRTVSNVRHDKFRRGIWLPWKQPHEWGWSFQGRGKKTRRAMAFSTTYQSFGSDCWMIRAGDARPDVPEQEQWRYTSFQNKMPLMLLQGFPAWERPQVGALRVCLCVSSLNRLKSHVVN